MGSGALSTKQQEKAESSDSKNSTDKLSSISGLNNPTEVKHLGLPTSQSELRKTRGREVKCQVSTAKEQLNLDDFNDDLIFDVDRS